MQEFELVETFRVKRSFLFPHFSQRKIVSLFGWCGFSGTSVGERFRESGDEASKLVCALPLSFPVHVETSQFPFASDETDEGSTCDSVVSLSWTYLVFLSKKLVIGRPFFLLSIWVT